MNEALARRFWPGQAAVGRCLHVYEGPVKPPFPCTEVVGVVAKAPWFTDINSTPADFFPVLLLPMERFAALSPQRALVVRTTAPARAAMVRLRQEAQRAAALLPYVDAVAYDEEMDFQYRPLRLGMSIFLGLSALALVIAVAGLAVVTAHGVTRRTREMGIRLVLGAEPGDLVRLMARRTLVAMAIGLAAGTVLAYAGSRAPEDRALRHRARRSTHLCRRGDGPPPRRRHRGLDPRAPHRAHRTVGSAANRVTGAQGSRVLATVSAASAIARHSGENSQVSQERNGSSPSDLKNPT